MSLATETATLRDAAFRRSRGRCECCGVPFGTRFELDHAFGRAKVPQALDNVWCLTPSCHYAKTNNSPSAAHWHHKFISHALLFGYHEAVELAETKLMVLRAKGRA